MNRILLFLCALAACTSPLPQLRAQTPALPPEVGVRLWSPAELDQMLAPIALYPDPLLAQMLPAATLPVQIVLADRYLDSGGDPNLIDEQPWDPSIKALAQYPLVLQWMDEYLAWTTALGQAFLNQPQEVMDSIQRLRAQAQALGNLEPNPQENVMYEDGAIEILPANPQVIYLPMYQVDTVYVQRPYNRPCVTFGIGFHTGTWLNHDVDWHRHRVIVWHHDRPRPANWWSCRPSERPRLGFGHPDVWHPRRPPGQPHSQPDGGWDSHQVRSTVTRIGAQFGAGGRHSTPTGGPSAGHPSWYASQHSSSQAQEGHSTTASRPAGSSSHSPATHSGTSSRPSGAGRH